MCIRELTILSGDDTMHKLNNQQAEKEVVEAHESDEGASMNV